MLPTRVAAIANGAARTWIEASQVSALINDFLRNRSLIWKASGDNKRYVLAGTITGAFQGFVT